MNDKQIVAVRCQYYKYPAAKSVLDHADAKRDGFTNSCNVHWEHSLNNFGFYFHNAKSCSGALELMMEKHKTMTGKKVRVDNNVLFEHILCFSEKHYSELEARYGVYKLKQAMTILLKRYCQTIKFEFGFEPLGYDFHNDEGRYELFPVENCPSNSRIELNHLDETCDEDSLQRRFVRNIHCHVQFMNFDFSKRIAPLRHLMNKGRNENGKSNALNPHFERIQCIAYETFKRLGFHRSESKSITNKKHLKKEAFVKHKLIQLERQAAELSQQNNKLIDDFNIKKQMFNKVSLEVDTLKDHLNLLNHQIKHLDSLKHEMLKAIEQSSDIALKKLINEKISHFYDSSTMPSMKY